MLIDPAQPAARRNHRKLGRGLAARRSATARPDDARAHRGGSAAMGAGPAGPGGRRDETRAGRAAAAPDRG